MFKRIMIAAAEVVGCVLLGVGGYAVLAYAAARSAD